MSIEELRLVVSKVVEQLVRGNYDLIIQQSKSARLTSDQLARVIREYGRRLILPPNTAYNNLDAVEVKGAHSPTWSVRAPLWTEEEGKSDLTLELTIVLGTGDPSVELDDLHVL